MHCWVLLQVPLCICLTTSGSAVEIWNLITIALLNSCCICNGLTKKKEISSFFFSSTRPWLDTSHPWPLRTLWVPGWMPSCPLLPTILWQPVTADSCSQHLEHVCFSPRRWWRLCFRLLCVAFRFLQPAPCCCACMCSLTSAAHPEISCTF